MGKRARKTRWRTLSIADEHSDSEESNTNSAPRLPKGYHPKSYYNKFTYSSQSTPRRRYQHDSAKSTRSSSTTSENKTTFNEDEYTRITTPRQDVLFKKGYLNKPKSYQTQTSTGTSTASTGTGTSTGNGTPDHQSTDLDYESQFMFPSFVDQNGIYYVNSYEPYPLMLYNPSTYYQEYSSNNKSKRFSTGSLTESMSPNNEEATSQDLSQSGGEASNNVSDYSGHHVYNMVYPGYYVNDVCPPNELGNGHDTTEPVKRMKKRSRRKTSKSQTIQGDTSEYTDDNSSDEVFPEDRLKSNTKHHQIESSASSCTSRIEEPLRTEIEKQENGHVEIGGANNVAIANPKSNSKNANGEAESKETNENIEDNACTTSTHNETDQIEEKKTSESPRPPKYDLKPDAEEFIPRAYRNIEMGSPLPVKILPPNFLPIPLVPMGDYNNHAFIPPAIPINFITQDPKMFPNFVSFVPGQPYTEKVKEVPEEIKEKPIGIEQKIDETAVIVNEDVNKTVDIPKVQSISNPNIDIATVVSKLEVAAKEQNEVEAQDSKKPGMASSIQQTTIHNDKPFRSNQRYKHNPNFRRNHYNSPRSSPHRNVVNDVHIKTHLQNYSGHTEHKIEHDHDGVNTIEPQAVYNGLAYKNNPDRFIKNWRPHGYQNGSPRHQNDSPRRHQVMNYNTQIKTENPKLSNKNYSEMLKKAQTLTENTKIETSEKQNKFEKTPVVSQVKQINNDSLINSPVRQNQWISVSNRKKRKGKGLEESDTALEDNFEDKVEHSNDLFESYDVNLLEDVIPPSKPNEEVEKVEENIENILTSIAQSEIVSTENGCSFKIPEVSEIEKELIMKVDETKTKEIEQTQAIEKVMEEVLVVECNSNETTENETTTIIEVKNKKKSKKGFQKAVTKRVIITDIDLSTNADEVKTPVKKVVQKLSDIKPKENLENTKQPDAHTEEEIKVENPVVEASAEKKSKKKKKKPSKLNHSTSRLSNSSSNVNLSLVDDAYDFLLESSILDETMDKTNDEISQELDKIIQKGMYGSLEGKIKSLNIPENDDFFKTLLSNISTKDSSVEKNNFAKTPNFSKIFSTSQLMKPVSVEDSSNINIDFNKITLPDLDTGTTKKQPGVFLENPEITKILQKKPDEDNQILTTPQTCETIAEPKDAEEHQEETRNLYPITQAVKQWMSKAREATPEIEVLKSPSTIYHEFCDSGSETESDSDTKDAKCNSVVELLTSVVEDNEVAIDNEEEITLFSTQSISPSQETSVEQQDLLDYWDNDIEVSKSCDTNGATMCSNEHGCVKCKLGHVEQGEEVLEVYESKYGKNEDYLNLQKEVKSRQNPENFPRHGNLPYRAICCSLQ